MVNTYEIRHASKYNPGIWSTVAQADTWEWAQKIVDALNVFEDSKFAVYFGEKEISCLEEAMKNK